MINSGRTVLLSLSQDTPENPVAVNSNDCYLSIISEEKKRLRKHISDNGDNYKRVEIAGIEGAKSWVDLACN